MKQLLFLTTFCSLMSLTTVHAQTFWEINGNNGLTAANFVGTYGNVPLNFAANGTVNVTLFDRNGFVGMGTQTPNWNLHLHTNPKYYELNYQNAFQMTNSATGTDAYKDGFIIYQRGTQLLMQQREEDLFKIETMGGGFAIDPKGDVGYGTEIPHQKIHLTNGNNILLTGYSSHYRTRNTPGSPNGSIMFGAYATDDCPTGVWGIEYLDGQGEGAYGLNFWKPSLCHNGVFGNYFLFLADNGNIGVGTSRPGEKLTVNGKICAKEVRVSLTGTPCWPDFVFDNDYKLLSLSETEQYIKEHNHLPDMPTATEVEETGIQLGEMNALLLQKIEEMTLHIIDLQKQINELKGQLENKKGGE